MEQPALGRKIAELRKSKGLTQEELVEMCNVSVRTIQRIETGEVTPRSYTIKTILHALDYDLDKISGQDKKDPKPASGWRRSIMLMDLEENTSQEFLIKQLHIAWIFGISYFVLKFVEGIADVSRFVEEGEVFGSTGYMVIKIFLLISVVFFQRGFILIGGLFKNELLKIIAVVLIGAHVLVIGYDIASLFFDFPDPEVGLFASTLLYGVIGFIYGISLIRLKKSLGRLAKLAGAFEIVAACFYLTILLAPFGAFIQIPAELLEIVIIFRVIEVIKAEKADFSLA